MIIKKYISSVAVLVLVLSLTMILPMAVPVEANGPTEVWVDCINCYDPPGSGAENDPFCTIQEGVDTVVDDGTVYVAAGTYNESVDIGHPLSLIGAGCDESYVDASGDYGFLVDSSYVTIRGFSIHGAVSSGYGGGAGIWIGEPFLNGASFCNIIDNCIYENENGIILWPESYFNTIKNNIIHHYAYQINSVGLLGCSHNFLSLAIPYNPL